MGMPSTLAGAGRYFFSQASPRLLMAALLAALVVRATLPRLSPWDAAVVVIIAAGWPLLEWAIHVYVLHGKPVAGRTLDWDVPRKHRAHHRDPADPRLVFIPLSGFAVALPVLVALAALLTPNAALAATAVAGFLAFALHYEWVHFLVHTRYRPRGRIYSRLWHNHRLHHFRNEHYWYGVTMLAGDRLLGTSASAQDVAKSPTCTLLEEG
jgi:hypothetical protein